MEADRRESRPAQPLSDLFKLTTTARNKLHTKGISTIGELVEQSEADLSEKGFSRYSITGIRESLEFVGLSLRR